MEKRELLRQLITVAETRGGSVVAADLSYQDAIEPALQNGWLRPVGIGQFQITEAAYAAARDQP
jgi:hypothetical protein